MEAVTRNTIRAWVVVLGLGLALVCLATVRISPTDIPWHLATAIEAFARADALGQTLPVWPTTNTFSHSFPDYPLYQQYPLFHIAIYGIWKAFSWVGLSVFHTLMWCLIVIAWACWAGGLRRVVDQPLLWLFAIVGLQQRMAFRPEVFTFLWLAVLLLAFDQYRARSSSSRATTWTLIGIAAVQWCMVVSHQFFILGYALQIAFLIHLLLVRGFGGRFGISERDRAVAIAPLTVVFAISVGLAWFSPLGWSTLTVPFATAGTVQHLRGHVMELAPISQLPFAQALVALGAGLIVVGLYRVRRQIEPFELACVLMGCALAFVGWRGVGFFLIISVCFYSRSSGSVSDASTSGPFNRRRFLEIASTLAGVFFIVAVRWGMPPQYGSLVETQVGLGRSIGQWPDAAIAFLRQHPPPGVGINLGWYSGNYLVFGLYPTKQVFVDPRFEAYPSKFIAETIAAENDPAVLKQLIERYQPSWFVGETQSKTVSARARELLHSGAWELAYFDSILFLLVRKNEVGQAYLAANRVDPTQAMPDLGPDGSPIRQEQCRRLVEFVTVLSLPIPYECVGAARSGSFDEFASDSQ